MKLFFCVAISAITGFASSLVMGQGFPQKPVRIMVGSAAGGPIDLVARLTASKLTESFNQQFIVENRLGASGTIAAEFVARSPKDGYILSLGSQSTLCSAPAIYPKIPYDSVTDFAPIGLIAGADFVLVVNPSVPARTVSEFIALAKAKPGTLTFGSAGAGSGTHLSVELFKSMAKVDMLHVPYKGGALAVVDLLSGQLNFMFDTITNSSAHIKSGKLRALGVTSASRSPLLPDVPAIAEAGLPGYEATTWFGLLGPAGTPQDVVSRLSSVLLKKDENLRQRMLTQGLTPMENTPEQFAQLIKADVKKWAEVVRISGARLN